jgi:hypothetical protein
MSILGGSAMDVTVIYKERHREPFTPFTLQMNDGREFRVRHPEMISVGDSHVFLIDDRTERDIYLEPALIALMQPDEEPEG